MVKVVDNLLSPEEFKKLNDVIMGPEFPWYFLPDKVKSGDGNFQFCHNFILSGKVVSKFATILDPFISKLNMKKVIRIKANKTFKKKEHIESEMHIDVMRKDEEKFKTAVFYCNTNNGSTIFENGKKVESKANRAVVFDGRTLHCGVDCTDSLRRIVINFNYIDE